MEIYTIEYAQANLGKLLAEAHKGKTIVIQGEDSRSVALVSKPAKATKARKAGSAKGKIWIADDFDEPLDHFFAQAE